MEAIQTDLDYWSKRKLWRSCNCSYRYMVFLDTEHTTASGNASFQNGFQLNSQSTPTNMVMSTKAIDWVRHSKHKSMKSTGYQALVNRQKIRIEYPYVVQKQRPDA